MNVNKYFGLFIILLGLIFMIFPIFSAELVSIIVGLSLLFFGISAIFMGWDMRPTDTGLISGIIMIIGLIAVIFGFLFLFYIDALSFLVGIQFYIVGFIMIVFGISGLISKSRHISVFSSILILLIGIIAIALAVFSQTQPIYVAILIGAIMIIEGILLILN